MMDQMMSSMSPKKNSLRESSATTPKKDVEVHSLSYIQYPYEYYPYDPPSYSQHSPQPMPAIPMTLASSMTSIAPAIDHGHRFSSIINEDDVSSEKLTLYVNWFAWKNLILTEQLTQCLK